MIQLGAGLIEVASFWKVEGFGPSKMVQSVAFVLLGRQPGKQDTLQGKALEEMAS